MIFKGSMCAIVTPFRDGRIDEDSFRNLIDWQIASGTDAIAPCGTTGEAATLTNNERERLIKIAVEQAAGRVSVLAGAGSNSTENAIILTKLAARAGADGTLQVAPYYNKPTQEGLYQHFRAIALAVDLPMILYNIPGRTAVNISAETTIKLSSIDNIVGIKESSGDMEQIRRIARERGSDFAVLSGEDAINLEVYRVGGNGCISVTANIAPKEVARVWDLHDSGDAEGARELQTNIKPLNEAMFLETNPIPVKTALALMGRINEEFRLPLTPIGSEHRQELLDILKKYGMVTNRTSDL